MTLEFTSVNSRYILDLHSRVTIIDDRSGSGKTSLYDAVSVFGIRNRPVVDGYTLYSVSRLEEIAETQAIYIIDESDIILYFGYKELISKIQTIHAYFVLISRDLKFAELNTSVDDIVVLRKSGRNNIAMVRKYVQPIYLRTDVDITEFHIEDSTTGLEFLKKIAPADTFGGKTNWMDAPRTGTLVYDRCGFGSEIREFMHEYTRHPRSVLDWESFEYTLLRYVGEDIPARDDLINREEYYTDLLQKVLVQYGKTASCKCLHHCRCSNCVHAHKLYDSRKILLQLLEGRL